jgi:hypothetical protein
MVWTEGLMLSRQSLYFSSHTPAFIEHNKYIEHSIIQCMRFTSLD